MNRHAFGFFSPRECGSLLAPTGAHAAVLLIAGAMIAVGAGAMWGAEIAPTKPAAAQAAAPEYAAQVAPVFRKYCLGCHNSQEAEGELILESHAQAMHGGEHGAVIVAGNASRSRLIQLLEKRIEPAMPPEGNKGPSKEEIALLKAWIQAGAHGPKQASVSTAELVTPKIEPVGKPRNPIAAVAYSPDGRWLAVGGYGSVEIRKASDRTVVRTLDGLVGNVNDVGFSGDGNLLFAAAGEAGLYGELTFWKTPDWTARRTLRGHRDALLAADMSPDGRIVATGSYDQMIRLWDTATGKELRLLKGHNGPVFDVAFGRAGRLLASASGDRTVKLWDVATGERLDTFSQPTKDQYAVLFSPDGNQVIAGGVDSRIRAWRISPTAKEGTNELVQSLFAHEGPILRLAMSRDGRWIASSSEDRTVKLWDAERFTQAKEFKNQSDWANALAFSPDNKTLLGGRIDGSLLVQHLPAAATAVVFHAPQLDYAALPMIDPSVPASLKEQSEKEPNDSPGQANAVAVPSKIRGVLQANAGALSDADYFRFSAKAGQTWILETEAARKGSSADTRIDVLQADGSSIVRCLLRAVRDSAINFRPIDSRQSDPRLDNWQEMDLDQFLYMSGEVCRLFRAPRGPDSGYDLYSENGGRRCYFDTSPVSHALNEPVYIVEPYKPGTRLADNGLPVFPLYFSNDDDSSRKRGRDSYLVFTAPADGEYLARVTDVRGQGGAKFKYLLTIREPKPDFTVSLNLDNHSIPPGGGRRFQIGVERIDNFEDPIRIEVSGVPRGYHVTSPLVVERGQISAVGCLSADADAKAAPAEIWKAVKITAAATISGKTATKKLRSFGAVKLAASPKYLVRFLPDPSNGDTAGSSSNEIVIEPGGTVTGLLRVERHGFNDELRVDVENLPHGVIVDNIGLSKIMIRAGENERQISISAEKWVSPTQRPILAYTERDGGHASPPLLLRVGGNSQ